MTMREAAREAIRLLRVNRYDAAADELETALTSSATPVPVVDEEMVERALEAWKSARDLASAAEAMECILTAAICRGSESKNGG